MCTKYNKNRHYMIRNDFINSLRNRKLIQGLTLIKYEYIFTKAYISIP